MSRCAASTCLFVVITLAFGQIAPTCLAAPQDGDSSRDDMAMFQQFETDYVAGVTALSPVAATGLGDHQYDDRLDEIGATAVEAKIAWIHDRQEALAAIDPARLERDRQVDYALVEHELRKELWLLSVHREWEWNPLVYTGLLGDSIYRLMARDFAPERDRLSNVTRRLEQFPRFLQQVRDVLRPELVPEIHAQTAVAQNLGVLRILENMVRPRSQVLSDAEQDELNTAIEAAEIALREHQLWLESELLPNANGDFRLGGVRFDQKLAFTLHSPLTRAEIRDLGERQVESLHARMYELAKPIYLEQYPLTRFPVQPSAEYRRSIIRFALEVAYAETPASDGIVEAAEASVEVATEFIREKDLITVLPEPLEIILMPEFQRGVSLAYCDSPGPLDQNQKTFYAVSPPPETWTETQVNSFLREYNLRSLDVLTIHEAMPGHFLQLAHSNRYPGTLRHLLQSGVFIEGWAVYTEWMMCEEGFLDGDPLMQLITLKWYLRDVTNALLDQAVHVDGISRDEAMRMMVEDAFQEEREAAGKWVRAQLTSAQLSTYFVGYLEHTSLRRAAEEEWGDDFQLKLYHDRVLSFGSPPTQYVRAMLLDEPIPVGR